MEWFAFVRRSGWVVAIMAASVSAAPAKPAAPKPKVNLLKKALAGAMAGAERVVFAVRAPGQDPHWYANFGHWSSDPKRMMYGPGGARLCLLNLRNGKVTVLLDDPAGSIRDPHVHYDAAKALVSYRKGGSRHYSLYEIDLGTRKLRRITDGPYNDIEPCYLPSGEIVFCSSRCNRWVNCWHTQVAILYRCDADGGNARAISSNIEHDNTPAVLGDGRILYTRWEYIDRSQVDFHHLWTINPDGTGQMAFFGNMHPRTLLIDAVPIGGSDRVAVIVSPGHGVREHLGELALIRPDAGPDERGCLQRVPGCPKWVRDPCPLSEDCFLVAKKHELLLVDATAGKSQVVYRLPEDLRKRGLELHEPRAIRPRRREQLPAERSDTSKATGRLLLADVTRGRRMDGVRPGEVRKLLVLETLPKPVNFSGGPEPVSYLGTFTLERVLGTVPVDSDGSAFFELPANRPVFFVALDANDRSIKRMQSFVSVMPGETTGCVGCHEPRTETALPPGHLSAGRREPSRVQPFDGFPDVLDFPRDIQPILNEHCIRCHNHDRRRGGVILTGDRGPRYSQSYWHLLAYGQVADGRNAFSNSPPRSIGSAASKLMRKIDGSHNKVKLTPRQRRTVWLWLESGAAYAGTYASLGCGEAHLGLGAGGVYRRRCIQCHYIPQRGKKPPRGKVALPAEPHPRRPGGAPHERWVGKYPPAATRSYHVLVNLTRPEKSRLLLAPLAESAGGWARMKPSPIARSGPHGIVFQNTKDPDYQKLLSAIRQAKRRLDETKRFDMPGFRPNPHYVREMKRYGILAKSFNLAKDPIDVYETDRAYWKSFWYVPAR